jgi:outer membrane protein assembly factor BamB
MIRSSFYLSLALLLLPSLAPAQDWLTWGADPERTGWAKGETTLSKDNVSRLQLQWKAQLDTAPSEVVLSTLTAPVVVESVRTSQGPKDLVFVVGAKDTIYALDAGAGQVVWQKRFPNNLPPKVPADWLCPNAQNATPVIDKQSGIIYVLTSDGKLRGLSVANGEDRLPPTDFAPPYSRNWSLNLIDGVIYTAIARGCGGAIANFAAMDVKDPARPQVHYYTSTGRPGGAWGRGGMVRGSRGVYAQTADGPYDPAAGKFGNSVMALSPKDLRLADSFTPANWAYLNTKDLDLGAAGPVTFRFQKWQLVAGGAKEGLLYLLDASNLGGPDHHTPLYVSPRWGNDEVFLWGRGLWGAMASWEDPQGERWLFMPMWGPPAKEAPQFQHTYGEASRGSVMGFRVAVENDKPTLIPVWRSRDMHVPDPPAVANGVVFSLATGENTEQFKMTAKQRSTPVTNAILYAFDAATGQELYSSQKLIDGWTHFGGLAIAKGRVYVTTWDARVYCFGLPQ